MTHICSGNPTIVGPDNDLAPVRRQAITWTNADLLSIGPLETYFSEMSIKIGIFWLEKMHLKISSVKWQPFCLSLKVLTQKRHNFIAYITSRTGVTSLALSHRFVIGYSHWILTHWDLNKMADILQKSEFSSYKTFVLWFKFHLSFFLKIRLTRSKHCFS